MAGAAKRKRETEPPGGRGWRIFMAVAGLAAMLSGCAALVLGQVAFAVAAPIFVGGALILAASPPDSVEGLEIGPLRFRRPRRRRRADGV